MVYLNSRGMGQGLVYVKVLRGDGHTIQQL